MVLVTVYYGDHQLYRLEAFGSILSVFSQTCGEDVEVCVFTDQDMSDFPFPISVRNIDSARRNSEQDQESIPHLLKDYCLIEALDIYKCPILYFDTDLFFNVPIRNLFKNLSPASVMMNADEGMVTDYPEWDSLVAHLKSDIDLAEYALGSTSKMYNSGIVGLCPEHKPAILRSIELTRKLYAIDPVFNIQQFSTGVMLAESAVLHTCEKEVLHYWGWRRKFIHIELERFRARHEASSAEEMITAYRGGVIRQEPVVNIMDRFVARIRSVWGGWNDSCKFAYLCYLSSMRVGESDPEIANAWMSTCLDVIGRACRSEESSLERSLLESYFPKLLSNDLLWLDWEVKGEIDSLLNCHFY